MPKNFLVFASARYYPSGGWEDFQTSFDTLAEACTWLETNVDSEGYNTDYQQGHVVDLSQGKVVAEAG